MANDILNIKTINDLLQGKQGSRFFTVQETKTVSANDLYTFNQDTFKDAKILKNENGYIPITIQSSNTLDTTKGVLIQVGNQVGVLPATFEGTYDFSLSSGTFVIVDSDFLIQNLLVDSDGNAIPDSDGNPTTELVVGGSRPVVKSSGTDAISNLPEITESLTGIVPPLEPLSIVALGGAAISSITNTVKINTERKKSLLNEISAVASSASLDGVDATLTEGIEKVKGELDKTLATDLTQGVAEAVKEIEEVTTDLVNDLSSAISDSFESVLDEVNQATEDLLNHITPDINTGSGFIQDLFEDLTGDIGSTLQELFGSSIALGKDVVSDVIKDVLSGGDIDLTKATRKLALLDTSLSQTMNDIIRTTPADTNPISYRNKIISRAKSKGVDQKDITAFETLYTDIESALSKIDTTIAGKIVSEVGEFYTEDTDLADLIKRYLGAETQTFEYVSSKEELGLEFYRMTRPVSELIVHATETYTNANIGSEEIHLRHKEAGHEKGIQYHYVIRRDGRLQRGMPLDQVSDASNVRGHAQNCIDVVLVGGVNVPSDADNPLENLSSQSFTQVQMKTLEAVMELFYQHQPGGQIFGHNELDINNEDPYFDVISFVENKFGKKSVYNDLLTEQSLSAKELVSKKPI